MSPIGYPIDKSFFFWLDSVQDSQDSQPIKVIYKRIRPTKAAIRFFADQARARKAVDKAEREAGEFWKAVREFRSYPGWYTLPAYYQDCLFLLWQERCRENPLLDKISYHDGEYCRRYGCKFCSTKWEVDKHEKEREQWFKDKHKGRNERARHRRAVKKEKIEQKLPLPGEESQEQRDELLHKQRWHPRFLMDYEL